MFVCAVRSKNGGKYRSEDIVIGERGERGKEKVNRNQSGKANEKLKMAERRYKRKKTLMLVRMARFFKMVRKNEWKLKITK